MDSLNGFSESHWKDSLNRFTQQVWKESLNELIDSRHSVRRFLVCSKMPKCIWFKVARYLIQFEYQNLNTKVHENSFGFETEVKPVGPAKCFQLEFFHSKLLVSIEHLNRTS